MKNPKQNELKFAVLMTFRWKYDYKNKLKMLKRISGFLVIAVMLHQSHGNLHEQCIFRDSLHCQVSYLS